MRLRSREIVPKDYDFQNNQNNSQENYVIQKNAIESIREINIKNIENQNILNNKIIQSMNTISNSIIETNNKTNEYIKEKNNNIKKNTLLIILFSFIINNNLYFYRIFKRIN